MSIRRALVLIQAHVQAIERRNTCAPRGSGFALTRLQIPAAACALPALSSAFFQFLNGLLRYPSDIYTFVPTLKIVRKHKLFALLARPHQDILVLNIRYKVLIQSPRIQNLFVRLFHILHYVRKGMTKKRASVELLKFISAKSVRKESTLLYLPPFLFLEVITINHFKLA